MTRSENLKSLLRLSWQPKKKYFLQNLAFFHAFRIYARIYIYFQEIDRYFDNSNHSKIFFKKKT